MRKISFFDGLTTGTTPVLGNVPTTELVTYADDASFEADNQGSPVEGNIYFNTTTNVVRYYNGTQWTIVSDTDSTQTFTNKTIDGNNNTITNVAASNVNVAEDLPLGAGTAQATFKDHEDRITQNESDIANKIDSSEKGAANGVASLDGTGKVPAAQLPSYVDDVEEYADLASFPATGETGKLYIAIDTGLAYRWSGSVYAEISAGPSDTDDLAEGATNLYYTDGRADARIAAASIDDLSDVDLTTVPPSADQALIYDGTNWVAGDVAAEGGGGAKNFVSGTDSNFEDGIGNWITYLDDLVYEDGAGPVGDLTLSVTTLSTEILDGEQSLKASKPASDCLAQGFSVPNIAIPRGYRGKTLQLRALVDFSNATGEHWEVRSYDQTNTEVIYNGSSETIAIPAVKGEVVVTVPTQSNTEQVTLSFHCKSSNTDAYDVFVDEVRLSPIGQVVTQNIGEWIEFTPNITGTTSNPTFGTLSVNKGWYKRVSDSMHIRIQIDQDTAGTNGSGDYLFEIPDNKTIDTTKMEVTNSFAQPSLGAASLTAGTNIWTGVATTYNSTNLAFVVGNSTNATNYWGSSFLGVGNADTRLSFEAVVPIAEWADSKQIVNEFELGQQTIFAAYNLETTNLTLPNDTWVVLACNSVVEDKMGLYNTSTGEFTATRSGKIRAKGVAYTASTSALSWLDFGIQKYEGGSWSDVGFNRLVFTGETRNFSGQVEKVIPVNAGDKLRLRLKQPSGSSIDILAGGGGTYVEFEYLEDFTTYGVVPDGLEKVVKASASITASSSNLSIAASSTETLDFNSVDKDNYGIITTGASWEAEVERTGTYIIEVFAAINYTSTSASQELLLNLERDTGGGYSVYRIVEEHQTEASQSETKNMGRTLIVELNAGDKIRASLTNTTPNAAVINTGTNTNYFNLIHVPDHVQRIETNEPPVEVIESYSSTGASWPFTAGQWGDFTSITLSDGVWDIEFEIQVGQDSLAAGPFNISVAMGTASGNVAPDFTKGKGQTGVNLQIQTFELQPLHSANRKYTVSGGPQTIYLKGIADDISSSKYSYYRITARRIG